MFWIWDVAWDVRLALQYYDLGVGEAPVANFTAANATAANVTAAATCPVPERTQGDYMVAFGVMCFILALPAVVNLYWTFCDAVGYLRRFCESCASPAIYVVSLLVVCATYI